MRITYNSKFFGLSIILLGACGFIYNTYKHDQALNWEFKGAVDKVTYDIQHFPSVIIKGKEYKFFNLTWDHSMNIHQSDTLIKERGDLRIKLIKCNSKDTIYFNYNTGKPVEWNFNGVVNNSWIEERYATCITINGKEYELINNDWDQHININKGDTLVKKKGSSLIKMIKSNTRDTVYLNNRVH